MPKISGGGVSVSASTAARQARQLSPQQERQLSQLAEQLWSVQQKASGWSPDAKALLAKAEGIRKQINAIDPGFLDRARASKFDD